MCITIHSEALQTYQLGQYGLKYQKALVCTMDELQTIRACREMMSTYKYAYKSKWHLILSTALYKLD